MLKYSEHQTKGTMAIRIFFPIKDHLFSDFKIHHVSPCGALQAQENKFPNRFR